MYHTAVFKTSQVFLTVLFLCFHSLAFAQIALDTPQSSQANSDHQTRAVNHSEEPSTTLSETQEKGPQAEDTLPSRLTPLSIERLKGSKGEKEEVQAVSSSNLLIDDSLTASGQDERIRFLVLHYTALDDERSLRALTKNAVSSHYLLTSAPNPKIYQLVEDDKRAWHAGVSSWQGRSNLNDTSLGIEISHPGSFIFTKTITHTARDHREDGLEQPREAALEQTENLTIDELREQEFELNKMVETTNIREEVWIPWDAEQIKVLALLAKHLIDKYNIHPTAVVAHSDIAPSRKGDPGPYFPWKELSDHGIGAWPDIEQVILNMNTVNPNDIKGAQEKLKRYGYHLDITGKMDGQTRSVIRAFQSHFRPLNMSGKLDYETLAILEALLTKYDR